MRRGQQRSVRWLSLAQPCSSPIRFCVNGKDGGKFHLGSGSYEGPRKIRDEGMNEAFRAACVIGWPVGHSRSPLIHNYWIKQHGLDAEYRREAVAPEQFGDFITHLVERGYVGANVTVPHKEASLALSEPDDRARAVGAANTLWLDGSRLR